MSVRRPTSLTASGTSRHNSCWSLRERFQDGQVSGLDDELTITSIRYEINPRGQVQIESKDQAKSHGIKVSGSRRGSNARVRRPDARNFALL